MWVKQRRIWNYATLTLMQPLINIYVATVGAFPPMALVVIAALAVIIGDYAAKVWSTGGSPQYLLFAFLGYLLSAFFYIPSLLKEGLIITSVVWSILSISGFLVVGYVIFKEPLSTLQMFAVALGVCSIFLLMVFE